MNVPRTINAASVPTRFLRLLEKSSWDYKCFRLSSHPSDNGCHSPARPFADTERTERSLGTFGDLGDLGGSPDTETLLNGGSRRIPAAQMIVGLR